MALCCLGRLSRTLECCLLDFKLWNGAIFECKQRCHTMTPPCPTCAYDIRCMIYNVCAWQSAGNFFLFYCWLSYVHKCCLLLVDASNIWHVMPRSKVLNDLYFEWKALQASCQLLKMFYLSHERPQAAYMWSMQWWSRCVISYTFITNVTFRPPSYIGPFYS